MNTVLESVLNKTLSAIKVLNKIEFCVYDILYIKTGAYISLCTHVSGIQLQISDL